jgi:RNA polymerase sigma factor (TIGR02999 family)
MNTTVLLDRIRAGDADASTELMEHIYHELQLFARGYMGRERHSHTMQPTELAHEILTKLAPNFARLNDGRHLRAVLKRAMHNWLIDYGRKRRVRVDALPFLVPAARVHEPVDLVDVATALEDLARRDARASDVLQWRVYQGRTIAETAALMGVSHGTVEGDYRRGRAYLRLRLDEVR